MFETDILCTDAMKEKTGVISVIVPVYNTEPYLRRCIDSIMKQTYENLEIIIVDDGSTDGSGEICETYKKKDKRIKVVHKQNGGAASARNVGLEHAQGQYIGFVDSDDYIELDMYESLLVALSNDVDIVTCGRYFVYPRRISGLKQKVFCASKAVNCDQEQAIDGLLRGTLFSYGVCEKIYRKELFDDVRFPVGNVSEDLPVTYALFRKARRIVHIGEAKYYNFRRPDSVSRKDFFYRRMDYVFFKRDILLDIKKVYPQFEEIAEAGYISGVANRLKEIRLSKQRMRYSALEKRLLKVLRRMKLRIVLNSYMQISEKKAIWDLLRRRK